MKILYIVSSADTQSIPLEVGRKLLDLDVEMRLVSFNDKSDFPDQDSTAQVYSLGASGPLDLRAVRRLSTLVRKFRPDVIHVHHTVSSVWAVLIARFHRIGLVVKTEHNDHRFQKKYQMAANLLIFPFCRSIICNSEHTLRSFTRLETWIAGTRTTVVYNGIDLLRVTRQKDKRLSVRQNIGLREDDILIGSVVRFVRQKNIETLLKAFFRLKGDLAARTRLILIGDGPLEPDYREIVTKLELEGRVIFAGPMIRDDVYAHLFALDLFVMPSWWEGFCNAAVEALAASRPVIASDIGTLREVLGDHAMYFDAASDGDLVRQIETFTQLPKDEVAMIGDRGNRWALTNYSLENVANGYLSQYNATLEEYG